MSLRILFADDSMTAQNMGKKILTDAGYDVIAVSNGAAAVKKIAEQKPDIIILDVYMPGYSGLEVCEKVRGSLETLKIPVLLTVGKMEPYKPEDANRVKADGVIIKPFEASDLLAIIKKFEERISKMAPPPMAEQTVLLDRQYAEEAISAQEAHIEHHSTGKTGMQPMVEVPDHMASSAAFGDMLGGEPANPTAHFAVNTPASAFETSVIVPAPPMPVTDYELPVAWKAEEKAEPIAAVHVAAIEEPPATQPIEYNEPEVVATPVEAEAETAPVAAKPMAVAHEPEYTIITEPEPRHPHYIPVYKDPEPAASTYEIMPTSAPPMPDLEIPREPALQETAKETTLSTVVDHVEPGLMSTIEEQVQAFPASIGAVSEPAAEVAAPPVESSSPVQPDVPVAPVEATSDVSDADFEARVAAALAAYGHNESAGSARVAAVAAEPFVEPHTEPTAYAHTPVVTATPVEEVPPPPPIAEPAPSFEYHPPVHTPEPVQEAHAAPAEVVHTETTHAEAAHAPEHEASTLSAVEAHPVPVEETHTPATHEVVAATVEAALPEAAAAAAAETGVSDHNTIAQAVHRVMERLKPELVEEIMRELKHRK